MTDNEIPDEAALAVARRLFGPPRTEDVVDVDDAPSEPVIVTDEARTAARALFSDQTDEETP